MDLPINDAEPLVMHIDLNSCFAMIEQQANPLLRNRPVGVAANLSPGGCIISPSYEAKALGIKVGFRVRDAQEICPDIVIIPPDPDKYFYVHKQFMRIFKSYSPDVVPKSIDEAVIDFTGTLNLHQRDLATIAGEIKQRFRAEIGDWITCNIGLGTNRFLAKTAAGLNKPDGFDVINTTNIEAIYGTLKLIDLCGINVRFRSRLNLAGIMTPLEFLAAPRWQLQKQVFKSIAGYQWYLRLRGWEVDNQIYGRKSYGQSYALHHFTADTTELSRLLMKLCEKMGRRLRRSGNTARGIHVWCAFRGSGSWHLGRKFGGPLYATGELHAVALRLLEQRPPTGNKVTHLAVSCYDLQPLESEPPPLFETSSSRNVRLAHALDQINDRYGEYVIAPARMLGMEHEIIKRVPFRATTDTLSEMYQEAEVM